MQTRDIIAGSGYRDEVLERMPHRLKEFCESQQGVALPYPAPNHFAYAMPMHGGVVVTYRRLERPRDWTHIVATGRAEDIDALEDALLRADPFGLGWTALEERVQDADVIPLRRKIV